MEKSSREEITNRKVISAIKKAYSKYSNERVDINVDHLYTYLLRYMRTDSYKLNIIYLNSHENI